MVVWCNYLNTKLTTMKKLSVIVSLSLILSSLSWAEKYEYVRLKAGDTLTLEGGDAAKLINASTDAMSTFSFNDGEEDIEFYVSANSFNVVVGPGVISNTRGCLVFAIERASDTGSKTLAWNGSEWKGSDDSQLADNNSNNSSPVPDASGIKYDQLLGWCYFTDTPWFYSYTNGSWYYMKSLNEGIYVWNANLPNDGWMKLHS